jgi:hypothetical protein
MSPLELRRTSSLLGAAWVLPYSHPRVLTFFLITPPSCMRSTSRSPPIDRHPRRGHTPAHAVRHRGHKVLHSTVTMQRGQGGRGRCVTATALLVLAAATIGELSCRVRAQYTTNLTASERAYAATIGAVSEAAGTIPLAPRGSAVPLRARTH